MSVGNWDNIAGITVTTQVSTSVVMTNQEIVWGSSFQQAANDCYSKTHKAVTGVIPGIPINPVDPGETVNKVAQVQEGQQVQLGETGRADQSAEMTRSLSECRSVCASAGSAATGGGRRSIGSPR